MFPKIKTIAVPKLVISFLDVSCYQQMASLQLFRICDKEIFAGAWIIHWCSHSNDAHISLSGNFSILDSLIILKLLAPVIHVWTKSFKFSVSFPFAIGLTTLKVVSTWRRTRPPCIYPPFKHFTQIEGCHDHPVQYCWLYGCLIMVNFRYFA